MARRLALDPDAKGDQTRFSVILPNVTYLQPSAISIEDKGISGFMSWDSRGYRCWLALHFGQLSCQWNAIDQEVKYLWGKLHRLYLRSRVHQIPGTPKMLTHQGQTVHEGRLGFVIPGRHWHWNVTTLTQLQGHQGDERA
jgi:hypothetical protein